MSGFPIVDLVIGMIFIYFLLSVISSSIVEMILTGLSVRAKVLQKWMVTIFDKTYVQSDGSKTTLGQAVMDHCSVTALSKTGSATSYIDARNFTSALLEKISFNRESPKVISKNIDDIIKSIEDTDLLSTEFRRVLLTYAHEVKDSYPLLTVKALGEMDTFKRKVEGWYDTSMDRVSGYLKSKYSRPFTFLVALVTVIALNADSISIARYLYTSPEARSALVKEAGKALNNEDVIEHVEAMKALNSSSKKDSMSIEKFSENIDAKLSDINEAKASLDGFIPLGWKEGDFSKGGTLSGISLISKISGLLATVFAIMIGAPFWFDLLNKIANMRGSGKKPESTTGQSSVPKE